MTPPHVVTGANLLLATPYVPGSDTPVVTTRRSVEMRPPQSMRLRPGPMTPTFVAHPVYGDALRSVLLSRGWAEVDGIAPGCHPPALVWAWRGRDVDYSRLDDVVSVNHLAGAARVTTKDGLRTALLRLPWLCDVDPDGLHPRDYVLSSPAELDEFVADFRASAAEAVLIGYTQAWGEGERVGDGAGQLVDGPAGVDNASTAAAILAVRALQSHLVATAGVRWPGDVSFYTVMTRKRPPPRPVVRRPPPPTAPAPWSPVLFPVRHSNEGLVWGWDAAAAQDYWWRTRLLAQAPGEGGDATTTPGVGSEQDLGGTAAGAATEVVAGLGEAPLTEAEWDDLLTHLECGGTDVGGTSPSPLALPGGDRPSERARSARGARLGHKASPSSSDRPQSSGGGGRVASTARLLAAAAVAGDGGVSRPQTAAPRTTGAAASSIVTTVTVDSARVAAAAAGVLALMRAQSPPGSSPLNAGANVWLIKPAGAARGQGIKLVSGGAAGLARVLAEGVGHHRVVQKYVERPLTVAGRKLDLRMWALLRCPSGETPGPSGAVGSSATQPPAPPPPDAWLFDDALVRFAGAPYALRGRGALSREAHLCNHAVTAALPEPSLSSGGKGPPGAVGLMWSSDQLAAHLTAVAGGRDVWREVILPATRRIAAQVLAAAAEDATPRRGGFELYGLDFCVDSGYGVWLLEVNESPDLRMSTPAKARAGGAMLSDLVCLHFGPRAHPAPGGADAPVGWGETCGGCLTCMTAWGGAWAGFPKSPGGASTPEAVSGEAGILGRCGGWALLPHPAAGGDDTVAAASRAGVSADVGYTGLVCRGIAAAINRPEWATPEVTTLAVLPGVDKHVARAKKHVEGVAAECEAWQLKTLGRRVASARMGAIARLSATAPAVTGRE